MLTLIPVLLWVPFGLLVLITGLIFCIRGYKNGAIRSAFALGATVFSVIACIALSVLLSWPLSKLFVPLTAPLTASLVSPGASLYGMVQGLMGTVVSVLIALFLFPLLFLIAAIVLRTVALKTSRNKFAEPQKPAKWGGVGVGLVEALVFSLALLLPLYGSLSTYLPTLRELTTEAEAADLMEDVCDHPLVTAFGVEPLRFTYDNLGVIVYEGGATYPSTLMEDLRDILSQVSSLSEKELADYGQAELDLLQRLRQNPFLREILYRVMAVGLQEIGKTEEGGRPVGLELAEEDIAPTGEAVLDLVENLVEENMNTGILADGLDVQTLMQSELATDVTKVLNSSPSAVIFRDAILEEMVDALLAEFPKEIADAVREPLLDTTKEIVGDTALKAEDLHSLLALLQTDRTDMDEDGYKALLEELRRHPLVGEDKVQVFEDALRDAGVLS